MKYAFKHSPCYWAVEDMLCAVCLQMLWEKWEEPTCCISPTQRKSTLYHREVLVWLQRPCPHLLHLCWSSRRFLEALLLCDELNVPDLELIPSRWSSATSPCTNPSWGWKVLVLKKCERMVGLVVVGNQKATYRVRTHLGSYLLSPERPLQNLPWFLPPDPRVKLQEAICGQESLAAIGCLLF